MTTTLLKTLGKSCFQHITKYSEQIRLESSYKAALVKSGVKEFSIEKRKRKDIKDDQVRIQVHYCSMNSNDLLALNDSKRDRPFIPGYEFAGEVIEIGKKVTQEQAIKGEKVAALSLQHWGGFSQECVVNVNDVFRLPSNVSPKEAAVLISGHGLALFAFSKLCNINKDDKVVISASHAGLGLAAVDVAVNAYGAKVIAVIDTPERAELVRQRGAFRTIEFGPKLHKHVLDATDKKGVGIIYDAAGDHMLDNLGKCAASGGKIFLAATDHYQSIPIPPPNTALTLLSLLDLRCNHLDLFRSTVCDTLDLADQGVISGYISEKFDLKDINKAIKFIEDQKATGKVVVKLLE